MGRTALAVAFLAACAAPLARLAGAAGLGNEISLAALGLLGWVALGGLPRAPADTCGATGATTSGALGLALPCVALGAGLDLAAGRGAPEIAMTAAFGLAFVWLLAAAAERSRGNQLVACAWWLAVPCLAILPAVARWGRGEATAASGAVGASPLGWVFLRAIDPGSGALSWADLPWVPLAVAGGLLAFAHALPEEAPRP
jgi:hypothetical protein